MFKYLTQFYSHKLLISQLWQFANMIFQPQLSSNSRCVAQPNWKQSLKREIYRKNLEYIKSLPPPLLPPPSTKLLEIFNKKEASLKEPLHKSDFHSHYCTYIPLRSQREFHDELVTTFPYISSLEEKGLASKKTAVYEQISECLRIGREKGKVQEAWRECLRKYICCLDSVQAVDIYMQFLKRGIDKSIVTSFMKSTNAECTEEVFVQRVFSSRKLFKTTIDVRNHHCSISVHEEINEATIAKTMKNLFCNICLIYDCGKHSIDDEAFKRGFQYISPLNKNTQELQFDKAIEICQAHQSIIGCEDQKYHLACSKRCYKMLNLQSYSGLETQKFRLVAPIVKAIIKIGIQIFSYSPCKIWLLINPEIDAKVGCDLVFLYLIEEYNIYAKIERKFQNSQVNELKNEKQLTFAVMAPQNTRRRHKQTNSAVNKERKATKVSGTCCHFFVGEQGFDLTCSECQCHIRNFCLADCLCDLSCPLKKKGCVCKKEECHTSKCPCFVANQECQPNVCSGCFDTKRTGKRFPCRNKQIMQNAVKRVRIGKSDIPNSGVGAFAGEDIRKDDLVTVYTGEVIDHDIDNIRETLSYDLSFYNFASPQGTVDARFMGNKSRFINHADLGRQNLRAVITFSMGKHLIGFYAQKNIFRGQELLFDYDGEGELFRNHKHKYPFIQEKKHKQVDDS